MDAKLACGDDLDDTIQVIDIGHLADLLRTLKDNDVHSFQAGGITVVFNEKESYEGLTSAAVARIEEDDGHSTSNKRVDGFKKSMPWAKAHPAGKILTFTGELE